MLAAPFLALLSVVSSPTLEGALEGALEGSPPCADSAEISRDFWHEDAWGTASLEPCEVDAFLLFPPPSPSTRRTSERASFSVQRAPGGSLVSTTRHQARRDGWSHRFEVVGESGGGDESVKKAQGLSRRELAWSGEGWKVAGGDLADEDLAAWPRGLPRRALPAGWSAAQSGSAAEPISFAAAPRLQGLAAGVIHPRWSAHALRAWNPVESGREPGWSNPWTLSHSVAGLSMRAAGPEREGEGGDDANDARCWSLALHLSETRISRRDADTLSERLAAVRVASPDEEWALIAALMESGSESGAWRATPAGARAWALGFDARHLFFPGARAQIGEVRGEFSLRQRAAAWSSAWDPAVPKPSETAPEPREPWGPGEYRLASAMRLAEELSLNLENWRSWNPAARAWRKGSRARLERRLEDFRLETTGSWRASRAASGSISLHRAVEVEGVAAENPRWRARAWRTWNAKGPLVTGLFAGAEPSWNDWRLKAGCGLETDREDRLEATASGGFTWKFSRGWNLDAGGSLPLGPGRSEELRWRATVNFSASGLALESAESGSEEDAN